MCFSNQLKNDSWANSGKSRFRVTPMNETFARQMKAAETIMREDRDLLRELFQR